MLVILIVIQMTRSRGQSQLHNVLANRFVLVHVHGDPPSTSEVITKSLTTVDCLSSPENVTKLGGL